MPSIAILLNWATIAAMRQPGSPGPAVAVVLTALMTACDSAPPETPRIPPGMFEVAPVSRSAVARPETQPQAPPAELRVAAGQFFSYALPPGWRVGEDGQFALSLVAPDNKAFTVMVGNAGLPPNYPPDRFVYDKLMALQPQGLRVGPPQNATPVTGFTRAYRFVVDYSAGGLTVHGIVKCSIATSYDSAVMAMTAALAESSQWPAYESWLPLVADQISAANGGAFGARGIMAQNLQNSTAYGDAARQYRDWSQRNWQKVTDDRGASQDRNNVAFRENLGAVQTYVNPYDSRVPLELPTTYKYFWIDPKGTVLGTDDPAVNPNAGSTTEWKALPRRQP